MKKALVGITLILGAGSAPAWITHEVVPVDNSAGRPTDYDYYTWDIRHILSGHDDWTTTSIEAVIEADEAGNVSFNPRTEGLLPPAVGPREAFDWYGKYRNMVSSPWDWPNTLDNRKSLLHAFDVAVNENAMKAIWFDLDGAEAWDANFTAFRLTLRQTPGMGALTLEDTGDLVARVSGLYGNRNNGGSLGKYEFNIYRAPEPGTLGLLALSSLAVLGRLVRRREQAQ